MGMGEKERKEKHKCFYTSDLREMAKPKNVSKIAKRHFKRKPYSKGNFIIN